MLYILIAVILFMIRGNWKAWRNRDNATPLEQAVQAVHEVAARNGGAMISLPCRECGRRSDPPVPHKDAPPIPIKDTALMGLASGFVVTAVCRACSAPLISRVLSEVEAEHMRELGAVDGDAVTDQFLEQLADL